MPADGPEQQTDWTAVRDAIAALLRAVASVVAGLGPEQFAALVRGRGKLAYVGPAGRAAAVEEAVQPPAGETMRPPGQLQARRAGQGADGSGRTPSRRPARRDRLSAGELARLAEQFRTSPDRQAARRLLEQAPLYKDELLALAKLFALPVSARDNVDTITFKLVEGVVGARLRSEAIRTVDVR